MTRRTPARNRKGVQELEDVEDEQNNTVVEKEEKNELEVSDMQNKIDNILQLLSLKIQVDEQQNNRAKSQIDNFEKVVNDFDGQLVQQWFDTFEKNADAYDLTLKQMYVQARGKMTGAAKLFLQSVCVSEYQELKRVLIDEFACSTNSADVHRQLQSRKKRKSETFHEYILELRQMAVAGNVEEAAVLQYIVNGLVDVKNEYKAILYSCKTYKSLREQYDIIMQLDDKPRNSWSKRSASPFEQQKRKEFCFKCGSAEHKIKDCPSPTKCFKCNENGHIAKNCPVVEPSVRKVVDQSRFKLISVNGIEIDCLIDTGSDVSLVTKNITEKTENIEIYKSASLLSGLGQKKTKPIGFFTADVVADQLLTQQKFLVVPDDVMDCGALLGHDLNFKFCCDDNGFKLTGLRADQKEADGFGSDVYNIVEASNLFTVSSQHEEAVTKLIEEVQRMPSKPSKQGPIELKITPDGVIKPFHQSPSRLGANEAEAVKKQVDGWPKG
ncbi:uncharacterized protein [Drosophila kikkawai]|uniref:Uncharacterized protein n=1 Tax=Drosophila kikkawai TaxID=30033 RepID=A0ABM4GPI4_DROKI